MAKKFMAQGGFDKEGVPRSATFDEAGGAKQMVDVTRDLIEIPAILAGGSFTDHIRPDEGEVWTNLMLIGDVFLSTRNDNDDSLSLNLKIQRENLSQLILEIKSEDGKIRLHAYDIIFGDVTKPSSIENIIDLHQYLKLFDFSRKSQIILEIKNDSGYDTVPTEFRLFKTIL